MYFQVLKMKTPYTEFICSKAQKLIVKTHSIQPVYFLETYTAAY